MRPQHSLTDCTFRLFQQLESNGCSTLFFFAARSPMLFGTGHMSICRFSSSITFSWYKIISHAPTLFYSNLLLQNFFVFKCLNEVYSHHLTTRYLALQLVSNFIYAKVFRVELLYDFPRVPLHTTSKLLRDENYRMENSSQYITCHCMTGVIGP